MRGNSRIRPGPLVATYLPRRNITPLSYSLKILIMFKIMMRKKMKKKKTKTNIAASIYLSPIFLID
jgi:hypothetical protein